MDTMQYLKLSEYATAWRALDEVKLKNYSEWENLTKEDLYELVLKSQESDPAHLKVDPRILADILKGI